MVGGAAVAGGGGRGTPHALPAHCGPLVQSLVTESAGQAGYARCRLAFQVELLGFGISVVKGCMPPSPVCACVVAPALGLQVKLVFERSDGEPLPPWYLRGREGISTWEVSHHLIITQ
jgi:hypothetical protein